MTDPDTGMSDAQLIALGELAYWSGQAESGVRQLMELLIHGPAGEVIASGRPFNEMLELTERLLPSRPEFEPIAADIKADIARLRKAMDVRNVFLHGFWDSAEVATGQPISVRLGRRSGLRALENQTARDIGDAAQELADACLSQFHSLFNAQAIEGGHTPQSRTEPRHLIGPTD
jgi:hypothetical protein